MPTEITINDITGATPFDIYICEDVIPPLVPTCVYVATISDPPSPFPYTFTLPSLLDGQSSYNLKIIDNNNCEIIQNLIV